MNKEENKIINKFNKDLLKINKLASKCDTLAFPEALLSASSLINVFSNKEIDWNTLNKLIGKLNSEALSFHINCKCINRIRI